MKLIFCATFIWIKSLSFFKEQMLNSNRRMILIYPSLLLFKRTIFLPLTASMKI